MNRFDELLSKYLDNTVTPVEETELAHLDSNQGRKSARVFSEL